jgi:hypothetical protein
MNIISYLVGGGGVNFTTRCKPPDAVSSIAKRYVYLDQRDLRDLEEIFFWKI